MRHMKRYCIFLLLTVVGIFSAHASNFTNSFGIYLVTGNATGDLSHIEVAETPVISDADIISYTYPNHLMILRDGVRERIGRPDSSGITFVVEANGERIYLGAFMSEFSSIPRFVPCIVVDEGMMNTNLPPNALRISRGYPGPRSLSDADPRRDERIKNALAALHKLK